MKLDKDTSKKKLLSFGNGLRLRTIKTAGKPVDILSLDAMVSDKTVSDCVIESVVRAADQKITSAQEVFDKIAFGVGAEICVTYEQMLKKFLNGNSLIFCGDENTCVAVDTRTTEGRSIAQPPTSNVTKGPREGFVESMQQNVTLLRKRIKTVDFKIENLNVGRYTDTMISVCYINSIAARTTVDMVLQKIRAIDIDGIVDSSYIASFLDNPKCSVFKMVGSTEKPDVVVSRLLEGRVAIIVDGSPIVLTVPYMFVEDIQSPEDYYDAPVIASMGRFLRIFSALASLLLPALYVTFQLYNYHIIPAKFLITILSSTDPIPFTPFTEMIVVLVLFDILREANARMPSIAGLSLSIIGAVVLGDAAVRAGLLSAPAVMIGALSSVGLYTIPDNTLLFTLLRLILVFIGGIMGLHGMILSIMFLLSYVISLETFGTPYLAPFAPNILSDRKDAIMKKKLTDQIKRPLAIKQDNVTRQEESNEQ
ncbi:MAG TPA: spore germination protein [Eubacteriales bacterium]|nr:spore germination protein [Eubacteriales bacterium]